LFRRNVHFPGSALIALLAALALGAPIASAQDRVRVTPSVAVSQEYDSNVLRRDKAEESDLVTRIEPKLSIAQEGERGHARLWGGLNSRIYQDVSELDAIDRFLGWDVERRLSPRLSAFSDGRFAFYENLDRVVDDGIVLGGGRPDERLLRGEAGLRYALTSVSSLSASFGYRERDYSSGDTERTSRRRDTESRWGVVSYGRALSPRDRISASLALGEAEFSDIGTGSETNRQLEGTAQWARAWSPAWSTSFSAGLRLLELETEAGEDRNVGAIGAAAVTRKFQRGELSLSYRRETRPSSGLGSSLDTDRLRASYATRLTSRLRLAISGDLYRYRSAGDSIVQTRPVSSAFSFVDGSLVLTDVTCEAGDVDLGTSCFREVDDEIDSKTWTALVRLDWRIRERFFTFVSYRYRDQISDGTRSVGEFDSHRLMLGFRYAYPVDLK
jgi:opacity protein-like surface antigen